MDFKKYSSIENTYRQKAIDSIYYCAFNGGEWVVNTKIHGSNLSMYYDGEELRVAKRTAFIGMDSTKSFFGFDEVELDFFRPKIQKLYELCKEKYGLVDGIIVYGEWCGGLYPHPDVPVVPTASKVQKKHYYAPTNEFIGFDLKVNGKYVSVDDYEPLLIEAGFYISKTIFRGSFQDCIDYKNEYPCEIYKLFGLPPIEGNICEGNVIKPVETKYFPDGSRVILKNKNKFHTEKEPRKAKTKEPPKPFTEQQEKLFAELLSLINENRLHNVLSHIGPVNDKMFGKVQGLFLQDALNDFKKDFGDEFGSLSKDEQKAIANRVRLECCVLVREHFLDIIDGNY